MSRTVDEWLANHDNQKIPQRVKVRVAARSNNCCANCGVRVTRGGEIDHVTALINGGEHREQNLRLLCKTCHAAKSRRDVSEKSAIYQKQRKLGPLRREQSPWSKRYHAMKEWKRKLEAERGSD